MHDFALASIKSVDETGPGSFQAVLSTSALDRDGESIEPFAFDPLPQTIPIYFEHDWKSGAAPIGRGKPYYTPEGTLMLDGTFATTAKAQEVRSLVVEGVVDAMSVGFLNGKREAKSGVRTVTGGDVFEGSLTAIPINTGATLLAAKAFAGKAGARNSGNDLAMIQSIHDNATDLGADCAGAGKAVTAKSIVGSVEALQDRVRDALEDAYGVYSTYLRGVLPDDNVIVWEDMAGATWKQSYTDDGSVVILEGDPVEVDIHEVIAPDADADREDDDEPTLLAVTEKNLTDSDETPDATAATPDGAAAAAEDDKSLAEQAQARIRTRLTQAIPA